ncbi:hypothetical protein O9X98_15465 [Agrobacterium salinitolerans]|nr:hypothetical protein [Agrobacterium salinitolerans]
MDDRLITDAGIIASIAATGLGLYAAVGEAGVEDQVTRVGLAAILTLAAICGTAFLRERHFSRKYALLRLRMNSRYRQERRR